MGHILTPALAVIVTVILIGSICAISLQQHTYGFVICGSKIDAFNKQTLRFQNSVQKLQNSTGEDEIEKLFDDYKRSVLRTFEEPPTIDVNGSGING